MTPSSTLCINGCHLSWLCLIYGHFSSFMFFPFFSGCYWDFGCTINWTWDFIHFAWPATDIKGYRKTKDIFNAFNIVMSFSQFSFPTLVYVKCITGQPINSKEQYLLMHKKLRLNWHKVLYCSPLYRNVTARNLNLIELTISTTVVSFSKYLSDGALEMCTYSRITWKEDQEYKKKSNYLGLRMTSRNH